MLSIFSWARLYAHFLKCLPWPLSWSCIQGNCCYPPSQTTGLGGVWGQRAFWKIINLYVQEQNLTEKKNYSKQNFSKWIGFYCLKFHKRPLLIIIVYHHSLILKLIFMNSILKKFFLLLKVFPAFIWEVYKLKTVQIPYKWHLLLKLLALDRATHA